MAAGNPRATRVPIHLLLVDGLNLIRRVYAAQPGVDGPQRVEDARQGSCQSLRRALREATPTHAVVVFEGSGRTWRHDAYPGYKAGHKPMPQALNEGLSTFRAAFAELGVSSFDMPNTEADDVVATLAAKVAAARGQATILSTDKIFQQLISPGIRVRDHFHKLDVGRQQVTERFGVPPEQLVDVLALAGDSTNSIRGVPGIGIKTAAALIKDFGSLEWTLAAAAGETDLDEDLPPLRPRLAEKLVAHAEDARLSRSLVRLGTDIDLGLSLAALRYEPPAGDRSR